MTQEGKQLLLLLLQDLCGRLSYGVICECLHSNTIKATAIDIEDLSVYYFDCDEWESIEHCKPYLRSMSSMTEEERFEYLNTCGNEMDNALSSPRYSGIDWLNKKMFDYRGLIPMGLAHEAPKGMYNN